MLCLLGLGLLLLAKQFVAEATHYTIGFSGASGWSEILYVAAIIVVLTQPSDRFTFPLILGFAIAFQAVTVFAEPFNSSDIYRYVWDGIVQHARINPYRYVPGDPALTFLRAPHQEIFDNMNRRDYARTIYPPVAQMIYWLVTFFSPTVVAVKTAMIGFECLTGWALLAILRQTGRPKTQLILFAWAPLLVWEIGGSGHVDAAVFAFIALALMFRLRDKPLLTGLFLGLAVMTKFYPLVLFPALYRRRDWKMPAVLVSVCAIGYAIYASAGRFIFGFLSGYAKEEGINSGARFFLLEWVQHVHGFAGVPVNVYEVFCLAVLGALSWWAWSHATTESFAGGGRVAENPAVLRAAMALAFAMMLLFSPHYPWYITWLVPFLALVPNLPLLTYVVAFSYLFTTALAVPGPKMFLLNQIMYCIVAASLILYFLLRRFPVWRHFDCGPQAAERSGVLQGP